MPPSLTALAPMTAAALPAVAPAVAIPAAGVLAKISGALGVKVATIVGTVALAAGSAVAVDELASVVHDASGSRSDTSAVRMPAAGDRTGQGRGLGKSTPVTGDPKGPHGQVTKGSSGVKAGETGNGPERAPTREGPVTGRQASPTARAAQGGPLRARRSRWRRRQWERRRVGDRQRLKQLVRCRESGRWAFRRLHGRGPLRRARRLGSDSGGASGEPPSGRRPARDAPPRAFSSKRESVGRARRAELARRRPLPATTSSLPPAPDGRAARSPVRAPRARRGPSQRRWSAPRRDRGRGRAAGRAAARGRPSPATTKSPPGRRRRTTSSSAPG